MAVCFAAAIFYAARMTGSNNFNSTEVLSALAEQALEEGAEPLTIRALVEEASESGAQRALSSMGLSDPGAVGDIHELRQLLMGWRDVRRTARRALIGWLMKISIWALLIGLAIELKADRFLGS
ncbi:MAG: DUF6127 family protein [Sphingomonadales bacterium]|jgi:hypothetical protein